MLKMKMILFMMIEMKVVMMIKLNMKIAIDIDDYYENDYENDGIMIL